MYAPADHLSIKLSHLRISTNHITTLVNIWARLKKSPKSPSLKKTQDINVCTFRTEPPRWKSPCISIIFYTMHIILVSNNSRDIYLHDCKHDVTCRPLQPTNFQWKLWNSPSTHLIIVNRPSWSRLRAITSQAQLKWKQRWRSFWFPFQLRLWRESAKPGSTINDRRLSNV